MAIRWSAIHEQLGLAPRDLEYSMIEEAVANQVFETDALDWKRTEPAPGGDALDEVAKDVAAMANTRGGLIVYGVQEETGTGRAKAITGADVSERVQRRIRAGVAGRIRPLVAGIDFAVLAGSKGDVLVLSIPRSVNAPHIIGQEQRLGAPYRSGPETHWMAERELETAYRARFDGYHGDSERLGHLLAQVDEHIDRTDRAWIVAGALPRPTLLPPISQPSYDDIKSAIRSAIELSGQILARVGPDRMNVLGAAEADLHSVRVGLRRWIVPSGSRGLPDGRSDTIHMELHHNGAITMSLAVNGWTARQPLPGEHEIFGPLVESFLIDFFALVATYGRVVGVDGQQMFRLQVVPGDPQMPLGLIDRWRIGSFVSADMQRADNSRSVQRLLPVDGEVSVGADSGDLLRVARTAALDVLNQFGVSRLHVMRA